MLNIFQVVLIFLNIELRSLTIKKTSWLVYFCSAVGSDHHFFVKLIYFKTLLVSCLFKLWTTSRIIHISDYEYVDFNRMMIGGNFKKPGRSWVWTHIHQSQTSQDVHGRNKLVCLHCSREFSRNTSTGNLAFHLAGAHNLIKPDLWFKKSQKWKYTIKKRVWSVLK